MYESSLNYVKHIEQISSDSINSFFKIYFDYLYYILHDNAFSIFSHSSDFIKFISIKDFCSIA